MIKELKDAWQAFKERRKDKRNQNRYMFPSDYPILQVEKGKKTNANNGVSEQQRIVHNAKRGTGNT